MNFAIAALRATKMPIVIGSTVLRIAALEAIKRLDGPANGIKFSPNDVSRIVRSSEIRSKLAVSASKCADWLSK